MNAASHAPARPAGAPSVVVGSFEDAARAARGVVVVIDVFRAFTTAAAALANGAERIVMCGDLDEALRLRTSGVGRYAMGERRSLRPEDFDFGNSPLEIAGRDFTGETLIQTTSNGTRGVLAALGAERVYAGAFVTADATAAAIAASGPAETTLVAMGDDARADEDELCALYLRARLNGLAPDRDAVAAAARSLTPRLSWGTISAGDVDACLEIGTRPFAIRIRCEDGLVVARREDPPTG